MYLKSFLIQDKNSPILPSQSSFIYKFFKQIPSKILINQIGNINSTYMYKMHTIYVYIERYIRESTT